MAALSQFRQRRTEFFASETAVKTTVIVPSYKRPDDLDRCLLALSRQTLVPDEILVVCRADDLPNIAVVDKWQSLAPLRRVTVDQPGQVYALNSAIAAATGDILAITDDDAAPWPQWLERIHGHFSADPRVGGVGGRDWNHHGDVTLDGNAEPVGKITWFGRMVGNHHLGFGQSRPADFLKGANMSYRRAAIGNKRFDTTLRGTGAQVHNDKAFSLSIRLDGWKLVYDPEVAIDHYPGQRFDEDQRGQFNVLAVENASYNDIICMVRYLRGWERFSCVLWSFLVGTPMSIGIIRFLMRPLQGSPGIVFHRLQVCLRGKLRALRDGLVQKSPSARH